MVVGLQVFIGGIGIHCRQSRGRKDGVLQLEGLEKGGTSSGAGAGAAGLTGVEQGVFVAAVGVEEGVGGIELGGGSWRPLLSLRRRGDQGGSEGRGRACCRCCWHGTTESVAGSPPPRIICSREGGRRR